MNIWTGIILAGIAAGVYGLSKLSHASGQIVTSVKARIFSIDFTKLVIAIDVTIKNPTNTSITIKYPFLKLMYKGSAIASSDLKNKTFTITPFSQTTITNIQIPLSYLYIAGLAPDVIEKLKDKTHKIELAVVTQTNVLFAGNIIPYRSSQDISI